jgi:hypothetical protein
MHPGFRKWNLCSIIWILRLRGWDRRELLTPFPAERMKKERMRITKINPILISNYDECQTIATFWIERKIE